MKSLLDTIDGRIIDPKSYTLDEIARLKNLPRHVIEDERDTNLASGAWEQVWKKYNGRLVKSYRLAKKARNLH